jgi:hypothetical protein
MSIFGSIMDKIVSAAEAAIPGLAAGAGASPPGGTPPTGAPTDANAPASGAAPSGGGTLAAVDVEAVLQQKAAQKGGGGNWQTSIVDLLKLLDLDSSLNARKELANELDVHAGADGSAEENIALHKAVMAKLAENGGNVPASLRG